LVRSENVQNVNVQKEKDRSEERPFIFVVNF